MYFSCCGKPVTEAELVVIQGWGALSWMHSTHHCKITWCLTSLPWQTAQQGRGRNVRLLVCDWVSAQTHRETEKCSTDIKCARLFSEHNFTVLQRWPVFGRRWGKCEEDGEKRKQKEKQAATIKDFKNVTEKKWGEEERKALPDFPFFGRRPIYPVCKRVCVYVCVRHAGRKAFSI